MSKLEKKNIEDILGLHSMQEGMLFHYLANPKSLEYFEQLSIQISGVMEYGAFEQAWRFVLQTNEMLRTVFAWKKLQRPVQVVLKELEPTIHYHDLTDALTPEAVEQRLLRLRASDREEGFDLETGPLFRILLCKLAKDSHMMILSNHHIIFDGWSNGIILKEFFQTYGQLIRGQQPVVPVKQKYKEFLKWVNREEYPHAEQFWRNTLRGFTSKTSLPASGKEPTGTPKLLLNDSLQLPPVLKEGLEHCTKLHKVTLSSIFYTAWGLILQQYNGVQDVVFGTPVAGRSAELGGIEEMVGLFINTLPLRMQATSDQTLQELLQATNTSVQERQTYEYTPLVEITSYSELAERENLFDSLLVIENYPLHQLNELNHGLSLHSYSIFEMTNYALTIRVTTFDSLEINFSYDPSILSEKIIRKLLEDFVDILTMIVQHPERQVKDVQILQPEEQALVTQRRIQQAEARRVARKRQLAASGVQAGLSIAVSATFTAEPLGEIIEWWGQEFDLALDVQFAPYNQVFQELLDPDSMLSQNEGANLLLIRFEDWLRDGLSAEEVLLTKIERNFTQLLDILHKKEKHIPYFVGLFPPQPYRAESTKLVDYLHKLSQRWVENLRQMDNVYIIDFTQLAELYHLRDIFDLQKDRIGHLPFSDEFYAAIGTAVARQIYAWKAQPFKVIVLDCDNTLWKGVCGEDGALGVQVTEPYLALQRFVLQKMEEGMLLALCSKNNEPDVWEVFEKNPHMLLKPEHIVGWRINWQPKSVNLQELAHELNLGLDSLIFLDDSPIECSEVMTHCPEVLTLQLPEDMTQIQNFLQLVWAFDRLHVTDEDKQRSQMYLEERKRQDLQKTQISLNDFLCELELKMSMCFLSESQLSRVAQLTQRTNQFNLSTIRRTEEEIVNLLRRSEYTFWTIDVTDRFGDYGLVGVVISREEATILHLDTFLMSCRALGRGVEEAILAGLKKHCETKGFQTLQADFYPTKKNRPFLEFLERTRWQKVAENSEYISYQLPVDQLPSKVDFIECYYHDTYQQKKTVVKEESVLLHRPQSPQQEGTSRSAGSVNSWVVLKVNPENLLHRSHLLPLEKCSGDLLCQLPLHQVDTATNSVPYMPPASKTEEILVQIWSELLQVERIGIDDNFFALGGHSIKATSVISRIYKEFEIEVPFQEFFAHPTIRSLAEWICTAEAETYQAIEPVLPRTEYPLSSAQKRVFIIQQLDRTSTAYNISGMLVLEGELEISRLERAFQALIDRHESLRTSFDFSGGEPVQQIHPQVEFLLQQIPEEEEHLPVFAQKWIQPFDLMKPPLFRATIQSRGSTHYLLLDLHHIIADGFSLELMMQEVVALYQGVQLAPLALQYKDFTVWQNQYLTTSKIRKQEEFWLGQLREEIPTLDLPTDFQRPVVKSYSGSALYCELSSEMSEQLRTLARRHDATLYMTLLAVYNILLFRYTGQEEILIGSPVAGRKEPGLEQIIGMFVNTLVMRNPVQDTKTFTRYLAEVRANSLAAYENQDYPFELLVEKRNLTRDLSRHPLFDTMFVLQNANTLEVNVENLRIQAEALNSEIAKFDLTLSAEESAGIIRFKLEYATSLFTERTIQQMSRHMVKIIHEVILNPDTEIGAIELLTGTEREELLYTWNHTQTHDVGEQTLSQIFEMQAARTPDKIALICAEDNQKLTYGECNARANQLARLLRSKGVQPEETVALMLDRSVEMMIGILGIFKAGGVYLPISPADPEERINYMLADSGARMILTRPERVQKLQTTVEVLDLTASEMDQNDLTDLDPVIGLKNLAYVLYTSGTTGRPKGVMVEHGSVINTIQHLQRTYPLDSSDILLQSTVMTFDASIREILWWFFNGAACCLLPPDGEKYPELIIETIAHYGVTVAKFVPLLLSEILNTLQNMEPGKVKSLKYILCGGEALPRHTVEQFFTVLGHETVLCNVYGPTETSVHCTEYVLQSVPKGHYAPIGHPIGNMRLYVLDQRLAPVPLGVVGEIYIAGTGVARGYLNNPALTQERFLPDPFYPGEQMYRSGDLGRWLPEGAVEFVGRIDHQVKIRGIRIELGEIESQILQHPAVREATVIAGQDQERSDYLAAYYVATEQVTDADLRQFLSSKLPAYMVPVYLLQLDKLPLTTSGKVDRKALPRPDRVLHNTPKERPRNAIEAQLVTLWSEILGVAEVGTLDNFFELGGHSLKATKLISRISKVFQVQLPLRTIFQKPTIRELAGEIFAREVTEYAAIPSMAEQACYPLSSAQKRLYVLHQLETNAVTYNLPGMVRLRGNVKYDQLAQAFADLIQRHEVFRTSFELIHGEPVQKVHKEVNFELHKMHVPQGEMEQVIHELIQPFDLAQAPLLRVILIENGGEEFLFFDMHHIISDGISMEILIKEMTQLYAGNALNELQIQYKDFVIWQNQLFAQEFVQSQETYWLEQFAEEIPVLNLPLDYPRTAERNVAGDRYRFTLDGDITKGLRELSRRANVTLFMTLLTAYYLLLERLTGQEDLIVGTPVAGRTHADIEPLIGMFVNTLALRNRPVGSKPFAGFLSEVAERTLQAFENQDYPFEMLVDRLLLRRDLSRNPLFDTMFSLQKARSAVLTLPGLAITPCEFTNPVAKFDLTLEMVEGDERLDCTFEYATSLFQRETVASFAGYFLQIIRVVLENPQIQLSEIEILSEEMRVELLERLNHTQAVYPQDKLVHQIIAEQVEQTPNRIAALFAEPLSVQGFSEDSQRGITYTELNQRANQLARHLQMLGVQTDEPVGIMVYRSLEMLTGILAILKAGGAYLPIDPDYPAERIEFILKDSKARLVLTQSRLIEKFDNSEKAERIESTQQVESADLEAKRDSRRVDFSGTILALDESMLYQGDTSNLPYTNQSDALVYVIYTSGSTGKPKGVMIEHRSLVNRLHWMQKRYPIGEGDTILQKTPFTFDVSVWEIFWWAMYGARVSFLIPGGEKDPAVIANAIEKDRITTLHFVPSMLTVFLEYLEESGQIPQLSSLRQVFASGEALNTRQVERFRQHLQQEHGTRLHNLYGPTEAAIDVTFFDCSSGEVPKNVPIGMPIDNIRIYILDKYNRLQPPGVAGELCIAGIGLARGYMNRPELSREKFVPDPFRAGERMYRTGDIARWRGDGNLEYLGRVDYQVKIRGFRIELGEIELHLLQHPAVREAVVIDREDQQGSKYLCAYLVTREEIPVNELRTYLSQYLPVYMLPAYFVYLEQLPLSANGKIDRKQLPEPTGEINTGAQFVPPQTATECWLRDLWSEILGVERIGMYDDFFALGGHSLKATALVARINAQFGIQMPLGQIFLSPTIKGLTDYLAGAERTGYWAIQPGEEQADYPAFSAQRRIYVLSQFDSALTTYNMPGIMRIAGDLDTERFHRALQQMVHRHQALRTSFVIVNGELRQQIQNQVDLEVQEWTVAPEEVEQIIGEFIRPFDLGQAPLLRVGLVKSKEQNLFLFDLHHIISDGVSMEILISELMLLYAGNPLPPLPIQYTDFVSWQQQFAESVEMSKQKAYWLQQFAGEIPVLNLPVDEPRPALLEFAGDRVNFTLHKEQSAQWKQLLAEQGVTLYMGLLAAFNILLARYSGQEDVVVGSPVAGRERVELERVIGLFVNTLALRNRPVGTKTVSQFLREVKENALRAFENQDFPFETLVDELKLQRDVSRNPLFDVMFVLQNRDLHAISTPELQLTPYGYTNPISKFDLTLEGVETDEGIRFHLQYRTRLWKRETMERLSRHFLNILQEMIRKPEGAISGITILSPAEQVELLYTFNDTWTEYPCKETVHQLFEKQAEQTPERLAVVFGEDVLTYWELNERANQLARLLRTKGVTRDSVVGIVGNKSLDMIVGVLAILKAGGAYLPIDLDYPAARICYMLADAEVKIVLAGNEFGEKIRFTGEVIDPADVSGDLVNLDNSNLSNWNQSSDLMYILYTSGSTGEPKGVMIEHRSVNRLIFNSNLVDIGVEDRVLQTCSLAFDVSILEIWGALLNGAGLYLVSKDELLMTGHFAEILNRYQITVTLLTTGLFHQIVEENPASFVGLRVLMVGGDTASPRHFQQVWEEDKALHFFNAYGPTESTTFATFLKVERGYETNVPIGQPLSNTQVYILDPYQNLQPIGVLGELCIGGEGLARGYLKRPDLTADRFIPHPFIEGERIYRTGDLARWLADGTIEFAGRMDQQVKIRGFRIELGEIEHQLLLHPAISEAVVIARPDERDGSKYLCAYLMGTPRIESGELRKELARNLPEYMIPAYFVYLEQLPLTVNGKVDRKALPAPDYSQQLTGYTAPRNLLEEKLTQIWANILGVERVGIHDNFFDLGGHSLKATRVAALIESECQCEVRLSELFTHPTIAELAQLVSNRQCFTESIPVLPDQEYYELSYAQQRMWIIHQLGEASGAYNIHGRITLHEMVEPDVVKEVFARLVERHESLRTRFAMTDGKQVQIIEPVTECPVQIVDISTYTAEEKVLHRERLYIQEAQKPFDLKIAPLCRGLLVKTAEAEYDLIIIMHHIISDGWSMEILAKEFEQMYRAVRTNEMIHFDPLPIRYRDFAAWQNQRIADPAWNAEVKTFWLNQLSGDLPAMHLPSDFSAALLQNRCSAAFRLVLSVDVLEKLKGMAREQNASLFMVLLAGFNLLLARFTSEQEILLSIPSAGRDNKQVQDVIGFFVNTLIVRNQVQMDTSFAQLLEQVQQNTLLALQYQNYPLELVLEELQIPYPHIPVLFNMLNMGESEEQVLPDLTPAHRKQVQDVKYDLVLYLTEYANGLEIQCHYLTGLFKPSTIELIIGQYVQLLAGIAENPGLLLKQYEIFAKKRSFGKKPI